MSGCLVRKHNNINSSISKDKVKMKPTQKLTFGSLSFGESNFGGFSSSPGLCHESSNHPQMPMLKKYFEALQYQLIVNLVNSRNFARGERSSIAEVPVVTDYGFIRYGVQSRHTYIHLFPSFSFFLSFFSVALSLMFFMCLFFARSTIIHAFLYSCRIE